jgi:hypothetical protein
MQNDPWAWTNQPASTPLGASARMQQPEMGSAPAPQQGPLGMATQIATARGINMGVDKAIDPNTYKSVGDYFGSSGGGLAPVETAVPSYSATPGTIGSATSTPVATSAATTTELGLLPTASAPLSAAAAETGVAAAAETGATIAATDLAATTAATTAAAGAGTAAAATAGTTAATGAAVAGGTAAAAGAGTAAAAAPLAAAGPVGWAVLAALAAKKFGYI